MSLTEKDLDAIRERVDRNSFPQGDRARLLDEVDRLREGIEREADPQNWSTPVDSRRHSLLGLLNPPTEGEALAVPRPEPVDVTEEPHKVHDHGIDPTCRERVGSDGLLRGECVDTAPDVGPDEALRAVLNREIVRQ